MIEKVLSNAVREVGISLRYVEWLLEALQPQYDKLAMSDTIKLGAWCGKEESELKRSTLENSWEWAGRCKERSGRFAL